LAPLAPSVLQNGAGALDQPGQLFAGLPDLFFRRASVLQSLTKLRFEGEPLVLLKWIRHPSPYPYLVASG
jgi:hypothetical protein